MKGNKIFLGHILECITIIKSHLKGISREEFDKDIKLQDAVIRRIEIIGEAAKNITEEFKENHPEIPWHKIIGIRNTVIHQYFGINNDVVWDVCQNGINELELAIKNITDK
jgi:uncharacterized protein with HEPN domain